MNPNYSFIDRMPQEHCQFNGVALVCNMINQENARYRGLSRSALIKGRDRTSPNPWSYNRWFTTATQGSMLTTRKADNLLYASRRGWISPYYISAPPENSNLYNETLEKLADKVRGGVDLSIDLAQAGQTARMFNAIDQVTSMAEAIGIDPRRRGSPLNRRMRTLDQIRAFGSKWLEYRYGWSPLLQTIYDCADSNVQITRNLMTKFRAVTVRGIPEYTSNLQLPLAGANPRVNVKVKGKDVCEINISLKVRDGDFNLNQWTSLNPASILWELVPYSFVVDWFYDVGGYLRTLETAMLSRNDFVSGYISTLRAFDATSEPFTGQFSDFGYQYDFIECWSSMSVTAFNRSLLPSYPFPRRPRFSADLGTGRLLNAAGLLSQFLGRSR